MKLTEKQQQKILFLYEWNMTIMEYYDFLQPELDYDWRDDFEEPKMTKSDLESWQMAYNDSLEMIQDLDPKQYKKLDEILRKKFGHGLFEADQKHIKRVTKIVEKGKISNKEQYYLLREYFERIWDMPEYKETAKKIEDIMFTFEKIKI